MMIERISVNAPAEIGKEAIDIIRSILDTEIKILVYPECTHPKKDWQCEDCEDSSKECNCNGGCYVICGNCSERLEKSDGLSITCSDFFNDVPVLSFKQSMERKKASLVILLNKEIGKRRSRAAT